MAGGYGQTSATATLSKYEYGTDVTVSASPSQGYHLIAGQVMRADHIPVTVTMT